MCGITGKIYFKNGMVRKEEIERMNDKIKHRGPDDGGVYINTKKNVGLGHRRLSIIDLSPLGHQPMSNEDGTVWITFNGEIYNFQSLRQDLVNRGHKFKSHTDTETIVHLWEEFGAKCLQYLRGMFAFAIWDENKKKLFIARDRVGKKPLKYYIGKNFIVFASELKAFIEEPEVPREIDYEAIHQYLTFQYVPHPLTGFKNIKKLPPAHYMLIDLSKEKPKIIIERYWKLDYNEKLNLSEKEWQKIILEKLEECVKLRMVSDVPLGAFLFGGTDSSAIVALMAQNSSKPVKTFSIGFDENKFNELNFARIVAKKYHTEHEEFIVRPNVIEALPSLVYHYEKPYADSSALPSFCLSELTKKYVTVALNGDGGDENFAGYPWYKILRLANIYKRFPKPIKIFNKKIIGGIESLYPSSFLLRYGTIFANNSLLSKAKLHIELMAYFDEKEKKKLYSKEFQELTKNWHTETLLNEYYQTQNIDSVDAALLADINTYLPDDLLTKFDIATMAYGLEARSPLLDHTFMELAAKIPSNLKLKRFQNKYIFKKALLSLLPKEVLYRKKQGFEIPINKWLAGPLEEYAKSIIFDGKISKHLFNKAEINNVFQKNEIMPGQGRKIWALMNLELWHKKFLLNKKND